MRIIGVNSAQASILAIDFWTSKGFIVHSGSHNCIVLRSNKYGSTRSLLSGLFGNDWTQVPMELTVLCKVIPQEVEWNLSYKLHIYYTEESRYSFALATRGWVDEFVDFCNQWISNSTI
jgi:hypothetical protein